MKRLFFGCLWWVLLFFGTCVAVAVTVGIMAKDDPQAPGRAGQQFGGLICLGTFVLALGLTLVGALPGTGRRKPAEPTVFSSESGFPPPVELARFNPAHPSAWSAPAPPSERTSPVLIEGTSEHGFTFGGFIDRWSRIGPGVPVFGGIGMFMMSAGAKAGQQSVLYVGGGFLALGLAILAFLIYRLFTVLEVKLGPEGVTWSGVFWPRRRSWEEIARVYHVETITNRRWRVRDLRLEFVQGGSVTFDQSIQDFDSLAAQIQTIVGNLALPRKRAELAQGKAEFGPVTLTPEGIEMNIGYIKKDYSWSDLGRYAIENGHLVLYGRPGLREEGSGFGGILNALFFDFRPGANRGVRLSQVPNYPVLLTLLDACGAVRR